MEDPPLDMNGELKRRWREMRDLIVRGVNDAASLTVDEVRLVIGIALLSLDRLIASDGVAPPSLPRR